MRIGICLGLLWILSGMAMANGRCVDEVGAGDSLPHFTVISDNGKTYDAQTITGRPMVLVFFNTHCWNCRQELPVIQEMYKEFGGQVDFLCISRAQCADEVGDYWRTQGLTLPYSAQEDRQVFQLFAEKTIPRLYVVNKNGVVEKVYVEKVRRRSLRRTLHSLLEKK